MFFYCISTLRFYILGVSLCTRIGELSAVHLMEAGGGAGGGVALERLAWDPDDGDM